MAHMIEEHDKGAVGFCEIYGGTWHGLDQYEEINGPVSRSKTKDIFDFELEKQRLFREKDPSVMEPVNSWCIRRTDKNVTLVPYVGSKFDVMSHKIMFEHVEKGLLSKYPGLEIESSGTLENGATAFVNLKVKEMEIRGDESRNLCRMMFYNPLGRGCYALGVHNVRIVCNNTLQASEAQAAANGSLKKIRHTASAADQINDALVDLAEIRLGLDSMEAQMQDLAREGMTARQVQAFLEQMFPVSEDISQAAATRRQKKRDRVTELYERAEGLENQTRRSKYSMLQAVTYWFDHPETLTKNQDQIAVAWDGMIGNRAQQKNQAMRQLQVI